MLKIPRKLYKVAPVHHPSKIPFPITDAPWRRAKYVIIRFLTCWVIVLGVANNVALQVGTAFILVQPTDVTGERPGRLTAIVFAAEGVQHAFSRLVAAKAVRSTGITGLKSVRTRTLLALEAECQDPHSSILRKSPGRRFWL
jgi:hypothetical protein